MAENIIINDVGPRDGLQNQARVLTPAQRIQLINSLIAAGMRNIEVGAFVSPKAVPAMAGTDEVVAGLPRGDYEFSTLIPNRRGYDMAMACGVGTVGLVVASSETMNQKNINMSTAQAVDVSRGVLDQSRVDGIRTQVYLATAWECPFEGAIATDQVVQLAVQLFEAGANEVVLADTIGAASPADVKQLLKALDAAVDLRAVSCHFHDTRAMGVANVFAAVESGIRKFDASIGGLGGCPFAPGATGNVATEDVVVMLHQMGFETGVNLRGLVAAADLASELTGNCDGGHSIRWIKRQIEMDRI
ncbi:hydroxymethylglutaryl-CoA lyase [Zhongshania borealis]|uniref:Hydroxymethylglutaryl-CoA lyase n=1 Tax=Zhongshania borealis TaxID=889488 RepID=A0ABP7WWB3_9GAMM